MELKDILRHIPKVDELLAREDLLALSSELTAAVVREAVRAELDELRRAILAGSVTSLPETDALTAAICRRAHNDALPSLRGVINGTGDYRTSYHGFGGRKMSGIGREGAIHTLEEFSETKTIVLRRML